LKIGVLGLQGAVSEHVRSFESAFEKNKIAGSAFSVRSLSQLEQCDAVAIPGGESTTISRLLIHDNMFDFLSEQARCNNLPILGTCAGMILLAKQGDKQVEKTKTRLLGVMDFRVDRNFFGGQRESFELPLKLSFLQSNFPGVFIRSPVAENVWGGARVVCRCNNSIVGVEQGPHLALSFHPELSGDLRIHEYFIKNVLESE